MKVIQTKAVTPASAASSTTATAAKTEAPFFAKGDGQRFFHSKTTEQSFFGNNAFAQSGIQAKLSVGKPNDPYEKQADAMADKVVQRLSISPSPIQKKEVPTGKSDQPTVQSKCNECEKEEKVQKKEEKAVSPEKILRKSIFESNDEKNIQRKAVPLSPLVKKQTFSITKGVTSNQAKRNECDQEEKVQKKENDQVNEKPQLKPLTETTDIKKVQAKAEPGLSTQIKPLVITPVAVPSVQAKCAACEQEEKIQEKEDDSDKVPIIQKKPIFESNSDNEDLIQRSCRECEEGDQVFLKPINTVQLDAAEQQATGDGTRESIVSMAKAELGKVRAKENDGTGKRVGSERLLEYFHIAAPDVWPDSIIETAGAQIPSWCGIFSVWAHKKAGKDIGNWQIGKGVSAFGTLSPTQNPQPGDIGYIDQPYQHHCIVERIEGDTIFSIDGNSGAASEVKENQKPRSAYSGFLTAFGGSSGSVQRKEDTSTTVKLKSEGRESAVPSSIETKLSSAGGGNALPSNTRSNMEQHFGADFSRVKIHTDSGAVQMSKNLGAQAFTHGNNIYFNAGKFDTGSGSGQHLLAHELTHTIQQGASVKKKETSVIQEAPDVQEPPAIQQAHEIKKAPPVQEVPTIQKVDMKSVDAVYDALDGYTSSDDSFIIWNNFDSRTKSDTDDVMSGVASKASKSVPEIFEWMKDDMVTADWKLLLAQFIKVKAYLVEKAIAVQVVDLISGYTSEDDSNEILSLLSGVTGDLLSKVLTQLEAKAEVGGRNKTSEWLFEDLSNVAAYRLTVHFFKSGDSYAAEYAAYWTAYSIKDLISGFTGFEDSLSIYQRFERVPNAEMRNYVLYELEILTQAEWSEPASESLMDDMWQKHYLALKVLLPKLPAYNPNRSFLESAWEGITDAVDFLVGVIEYAVCGLVGVVIGALSVIVDIVVLVWDILIGAKDIVGMILYFLSGGSICRENKDKVYAFFEGLGKFFDAPGDSVGKMWDEMVLEASLMEGPFKECQQAYFWTKRIANLIVNIVLIFLAGYGAVKLVLEGIEGLVALVRAGELLNALKGLPGKLLTKIKGLPAAAANSTSRAVKAAITMMRNPIETIGAARTSLTSVRLAAEKEGYFQFLRQQAGKVVEKESTYWKERKDFWKKGADDVEGGLGNSEEKLTTAANTVVDDPANAEKLINESDEAAKVSQKHADDLLDEVKGNKEGKPPEKTPNDKPPVPKQPMVPKQVDYGGNDLSQMCINERRRLGPRQVGPPQNIAGQSRANFAVFEYVENGQTKRVLRKSEIFKGHSEKLIHEELQQLGIKAEQVTRIYTERAPCTSKGCSTLIRKNYPNAEVSYSFEFGADAASMEAGNAAHAKAVDNIFASKTP